VEFVEHQKLQGGGIDCRVGHPAKTRAAEPRKQNHDRQDAALLLKLLTENRFPSIWMPSTSTRYVLILNFWLTVPQKG